MPVFPLSRRKRDEKNIGKVLSGEKDSYRVRSKKSVDPTTGKSLTRGSIVKKGPDVSDRKLTGFSAVPIMKSIKPGGASLSVTRKFEPADMAEGSVKKRTTTADHSKKFNENPLKVEARIKAQSEGRTSYKAPGTGKEELSGVATHTTKTSVGKPTVERTSMAVPQYTSTKKPSLKVEKPAAKKPGGGFSVAIRTKAGSDKQGTGSTKKVLSIGKLNIPLSNRGTKKQVSVIKRRNQKGNY